MHRRLAVMALLAAIVPTASASSYSFETGTGNDVIIIDGPPASGTLSVLLGSQETQLMLELINRARANPAAEAERLGIDLNDGLPAGTITPSAKPPLAYQLSLHGSASQQAVWISNSGTLSHTGQNNSTPASRAQAGGYVISGSNALAESVAVLHTDQMDGNVSVLHDYLFKSAEDRKLMLDPRFDEIGIGLVQPWVLIGMGGFTPQSLFCSHVFAFSAGSPTPKGPYLLGVAYKDTNANGFYDVGEGLPNVTVRLSPSRATAVTNEAGGFAIPRGTTSGSLVVTFSGPAIPATTQIPVSAMPGQNVKVDLVVPGSGNTQVLEITGDLDFGKVEVNHAATRTITIKNVGNSYVHISGISHSSPAFSGSIAGSLSPNSSRTLNVSFVPTAATSYSGTLSVIAGVTGGTTTMVETGKGYIVPDTATPEISPNGGSFSEKVRVKITCADRKSSIRYTTDGSLPTQQSRKYNGPLTLRDSTTLKARAFKAGATESDPAEATFTKN